MSNETFLEEIQLVASAMYYFGHRQLPILAAFSQDSTYRVFHAKNGTASNRTEKFYLNNNTLVRTLKDHI